MNHLIRLKITSSVLIILSFISITLLPTARAVTPPPDGGYPGGNTAEGQAALLSLTTGGFNTAVGFLSLRSNTDGSFNTGLGAGTLLTNTGGDSNTATGTAALLSNTTGGLNTANGTFALFSNTIGVDNTANGFQALFSNVSGSENTASGIFALLNNTSGGFNTAIGEDALVSNTTGIGNTALGAEAGTNITTANSVICLGAGVLGANVSNSCFIGEIRGITTVNNDAVQVVIDSAGQLGTMSSSRRFKNQIQSMDKASEAILALKPVTFHYKSDKTKRPEFGLIAEEVAEVNPDLVVRNRNGEIYTVRYDAVNAMLLNEFLKDHRKVEEQQAHISALDFRVAKQEAMIAEQQKEFQATVARQEKEIGALTATVKEQAAHIQKVSAQIETQMLGSRTLADSR